MGIKITALVVVINDADYIWWALKSVYDAVDKIVIVEGAARDNWKESYYFTPMGLSTDNTQHEILKFIAKEDPDRKIVYLRTGFEDTKNALRDVTLRLCPSDTDYCLVVDADHLYDAAQIGRLRELCTEYPNIRVAYAEHLMFFQDMRHILVVDSQYRERLGYHLACFFWRYKPELRYFKETPFSDHSLGPGEWVHSAPKVTLDELPESKGDVRIYPPVFQFWHFGWVRRRTQIERHIMRANWSQLIRVERLLKEDPDKLTDGDRRVWVPLIRLSEKEILERHHLYHKIWTGLFDQSVGEHLVPYNGVYPLEGLIEKHPFWGKDRAWFGLEGVL